MTQTHKFKLPSGVECEITELTGKQQRILTEQTKKPHNEKLAEMLASVIVRIGKKTDIDVDFIKKEMLICDRNFALVELRQYSLDFEDSFTFNHTYKDEAGNKQTVEIEENIPAGHFPLTTVKKLTKDEAGNPLLVDADYGEYSDIEKDVTIVLPRSKQKVRFTMLDGKGEAVGIATNKSSRSSHTPIKMRNPVYFEKKEKGGEVPISLNLDKLAIKDIEFLRSEIKRHEGRVDTELLFENPATEKEEILDVISSVAFFFPSEAI